MYLSMGLIDADNKCDQQEHGEALIVRWISLNLHKGNKKVLLKVIIFIRPINFAHWCVNCTRFLSVVTVTFSGNSSFERTVTKTVTDRHRCFVETV